ncbi:MAG: hypothetical protein WBF17_02590 [Phycisphaerae bacterium]
MADALPMTFQRFGRSHHLRIETADDLALVRGLDEAHWVATGAPIDCINCDATFLRLVDSDNNGRIMCAEVLEAVGWLLENLRDTAGVTARSMSLRLAAIDTDTGEGQRVLQSAGKMLARLGLADAGEVTLSQVRQIKQQVASTPVSEAGVVLPEASQEEKVRQFLADVIAAVGGAEHPSGSPGVGTEQLEKFLSFAAAAVDWFDRGQMPPGAERTDIMPLGDRTPAAYELLSSLRGKIDQYFAQCEAVALDERFAQRMGWTEEELKGLDFDDPGVIEKVLQGAPLAKGRPDRALRLDEGVNPFYAGALERLRQEVMAPAIGEGGQCLSARQWHEIKGFFAAHREWVRARPEPKMESLGIEKLRGYLDERYAQAVRELIADSRRTAFDLDNIRLTEKLILYQAYMIDFANNFVSFPHLYDPASRAMFEMGTLVMDGRRFNLAVRVSERNQHTQIAGTSNMCLLYVAIAPRDGGKEYEVAVPVTSGGKGNLCMHKRGIFHDTDGRECDARVVGIIENPISLREALVAPFKRLGSLVTGKIESLTTQAEKKLDSQAAVTMDQVTAGPEAAAAARPAAKASGLSGGGMLMGFGVAGAAIISALAYIAKTVSQSPLSVVIGLLIGVLLVVVPTSLVAWLKLRRRDLSAILEGSGWAVNARMRLTRRQSRYFTNRPRYPAGAKGVSRVPWRGIVIIAVLIAIVLGAGELARRHLARPKEAATQPAAKK